MELPRANLNPIHEEVPIPTTLTINPKHSWLAALSSDELNYGCPWDLCEGKTRECKRKRAQVYMQWLASKLHGIPGSRTEPWYGVLAPAGPSNLLQPGLPEPARAAAALTIVPSLTGIPSGAFLNLTPHGQLQLVSVSFQFFPLQAGLLQGAPLLSPQAASYLPGGSSLSSPPPQGQRCLPTHLQDELLSSLPPGSPHFSPWTGYWFTSKWSTLVSTPCIWSKRWWAMGISSVCQVDKTWHFSRCLKKKTQLKLCTQFSHFSV